MIYWKEWKWFYIGWPLTVLGLFSLGALGYVLSGEAQKEADCQAAGGAYIKGQCLQKLSLPTDRRS